MNIIPSPIIARAALALLITTVSACSVSTSTPEGLLDVKTPVDSNDANSGTATGKPKTCPNFSGRYELSGLSATRTITQQGCDSITIQQKCEGQMCGFASLDDFDVTLDLNSKASIEWNGKMYSAEMKDNVFLMTVTRKDGSGSRIMSLGLSDHPCDPENPAAGIEEQMTEKTQSGDGVEVESESCMPWGRQTS